MLVLSRRRKEEIVIGNNITVVVTNITATKVKLGIQTPDKTPVVRLEIPHWCKAERLSCFGFTRKQINDGEYHRCHTCPHCDMDKLP